MIKRGGGIAGKIITVIFLLISLIFAGLMIYTKMIPAAILAVVSVGLLILVFLVGILTWNRKVLCRNISGGYNVDSLYPGRQLCL